jgi:MFS family permease
MRPLRGLWPRGGLWRHADFLKLWSAETISQLGSQVTLLALPLVAILTLDVSAFEVALLNVVEFAPFILVSLPAGVWVDRMRRKQILVVADIGRALLLASVPLAYWLDVLTIWQLYAVGFTVGICTVFFDVAYQAYLPSLVDRNQLVEGNSKLEISRSGAQIAGPSIAGPLVQVLTAPVALVADALSFVASGLFLFGIRKQEQPPERSQGQEKPKMRTDLGEGLRYVLGNRYLRWIAAATATFNFWGNVMWAILLVYAVRVLDLSPAEIGLVFAIGNVGYLVGAVATSRISAAVGVGPAIVLGALAGVASLLVPLAPESNPLPFLIASQAIIGFGLPLYNVTQVSLRQAITPERLQGRMNAVMRFIVWGVIPLGALSGGAIASGIGLRAAIWIGAVGVSLAFLPVLLSPVRSLREVPEPVETEAREDDALVRPVTSPPPVDDHA